MKKIVLSILVLAVCAITNAQQTPQYTQYMVNPYLVNPALASVEDMVDIKVGHRSQWLGFGQTNIDGVVQSGTQAIAPRTYYLSGHSPIGKPHAARHYISEAKSWVGLGGKIMYDQTGPTTWGNYMISGTYNMALTKPKGAGKFMKDGIRMSFGMFFGIQQFSLDWSRLTFGDNEPLTPTTGNTRKLMPDGSVGLWVYDEMFFAGLSIDHLFGNTLNINTGVEGIDENGRLSRHIFLTGGANIPVNDFFKWSPSLFAKYNIAAPVSVDINNRFTYDDSYWAGLSYRHKDAIAIAVGAIIKFNYEIAYSYDITTSSLNSLSGSTHEITLGYRIAPSTHSMNAEDHNFKHTGTHKVKRRKR